MDFNIAQKNVFCVIQTLFWPEWLEDDKKLLSKMAEIENKSRISDLRITIVSEGMESLEGENG